MTEQVATHLSNVGRLLQSLMLQHCSGPFRDSLWALAWSELGGVIWYRG